MPLIGSGGSGSGVALVSTSITQVAHGFVVGDWLYHTGTVWAKANSASSITSEAIGVIGFGGVVDVNTFKIVTSGIVDLTGALYAPLTAGEVYYISSTLAGRITVTEPSAVSSVSKPVLMATSTTGGYIEIYRGTPALGQTAVVEYVIVKNKVTTANVANQAFFKPDTIVSGNIPYNAATGLFSLTAGKTYDLVADLAIGGGQSGVEYVWKDTVTGLQFGSQGVSVADNGVAGTYTVLARAIYTPTTNTTVGVVNLFTTAFPLLGGVDTTSTGSTGLSQPTMTIKQIGASPVPMDLVGEYVSPIYPVGNISPTAIQNSSATSVQFLSIPIPSAGTWDIEWSVYAGIWQGNLGTVANGISSALYDTSGTLLANSELSSGNFVVGGALASGSNMQGTRSYTVTSTGATTYNIKVWNPASSTIATAFGSAAGRSYVSARKISGFIPSSGQTVDYISAIMPIASIVPAVGSPIVLSTSSGNIPLSSNTFTLAAGKVYRLEAGITRVNSGTELTYQWRDTTNNVYLGAPGVTATNPAPMGSIASAVLTAVTNTTIQLWVVKAAGSAGGALDANGGTLAAGFATITQLGSSAVIAGVYPGTWTSYTPQVTATSAGTNPTLPTSATLVGNYSIMGKTMFLNIKYFAATITGGADGTQSYQYSLPPGYVIDTTKAASPSVLTNTSGSGLDGGTVGSGFGRNSTASNSAGLIVMPLSTTTIGAYFEGATRLIGAGALAMTGAANTTISFVCQIPLV